MNSLSAITSFLPASLDLGTALKFVLILAGAVLLLGFLIHLIFGKNSTLNRAVSSAMGILAVYVLTVVIYTFNPSGLSRFLAPLPFVRFGTDTVYLFSFAGAQFPELCSQILSMVILAFLVNLIGLIIPEGKKIHTWIFLRSIAVILGIALHYLVSWAFNAFLPGVLVAYAPMILLGTLVIMMSLGLLKFILGLILTVINPLIGALYAFFFATRIGKQLSKAMLSTGILCCVFYALSYLGFGTISISAAALVSYIPMGIILLLLWYLIGHIL